MVVCFWLFVVWADENGVKQTSAVVETTGGGRSSAGLNSSVIRPHLSPPKCKCHIQHVRVCDGGRKNGRRLSFPHTAL